MEASPSTGNLLWALSHVPCLLSPSVYLHPRRVEHVAALLFYSNGVETLRVLYSRYSIFSVIRGIFLQWVFPTFLPHLTFTLPRNLGNAWRSFWWHVAILVPARGIHTQVLAPKLRYSILSLKYLRNAGEVHENFTANYARFQNMSDWVWIHPEEKYHWYFAAQSPTKRILMWSSKPVLLSKHE